MESRLLKLISSPPPGLTISYPIPEIITYRGTLTISVDRTTQLTQPFVIIIKNGYLSATINNVTLVTYNHNQITTYQRYSSDDYITDLTVDQFNQELNHNFHGSTYESMLSIPSIAQYLAVSVCFFDKGKIYVRTGNNSEVLIINPSELHIIDRVGRIINTTYVLRPNQLIVNYHFENHETVVRLMKKWDLAHHEQNGAIIQGSVNVNNKPVVWINRPDGNSEWLYYYYNGTLRIVSSDTLQSLIGNRNQTQKWISHLLKW